MVTPSLLGGGQLPDVGNVQLSTTGAVRTDFRVNSQTLALPAVDAGIVYVTDVKAAGSGVKGIEIPADQNSTTKYPIATLTGSKNADLAKAFVDYVLSADGMAVLTDAGFAAP